MAGGGKRISSSLLMAEQRACRVAFSLSVLLHVLLLWPDAIRPLPLRSTGDSPARPLAVVLSAQPIRFADTTEHSLGEDHPGAAEPSSANLLKHQQIYPRSTGEAVSPSPVAADTVERFHEQDAVRAGGEQVGAGMNPGAWRRFRLHVAQRMLQTALGGDDYFQSGYVGLMVRCEPGLGVMLEVEQGHVATEWLAGMRAEIHAWLAVVEPDWLAQRWWFRSAVDVVD